jgi:DNA-binding NarL/FixJ family response regulator
MSGEEATRQIRAYVPGTRVIALSMFGDPVMAEKMRRVGAEAYLCKTDASEKLLAAIRNCRVPQNES